MSARDDASYGSRRRLAPANSARQSDASLDARRSSRNSSNMYQPGTPIGYLAARGTVYEKKYFTKKLGFCCLFLAPPVLLIVLAITLLPVLAAVADHALHTSQFHVQASNITDISNTSFALTLQAHVTKTGIFPAHLYFRTPINVYWNTPPPNMREVHLGHFNLAMVGAAGGQAKVNQVNFTCQHVRWNIFEADPTFRQATHFFIDDEEGFATFAEYLVSQEVFTWRINCSTVHAEAFSFLPTYKQLSLTKNININGLNNLQKVKLIDVQLPGNDPQGGIQVSATATLENPSPFGIQVGTLVLGLYYDGLYLGPVQASGVNLTSGVNLLTLSGRILPYPNNASALAQLGTLFTNYINSVPTTVIAHGVSATLPNGQVVGWLAQGITALRTNIPFLPPQPINPIKGIIIDYISLVYSEQLPYNPQLFSNDLRGQIVLPFGFSLNITQLATQITIIYQGANVGTATGPYSGSSTNITTLSTGTTAGEIYLTLPPSQLILPNSTTAAKQQLVEFQNAFVYMGNAAFQAQGAAKAVTQTPVGELLLDGIKFDVVTGLIGLNGLTTYPTVINSVDVTGGTPQNINLAVDLTLINPSNLNLSVGDSTLQLSNAGVILGTATLPNLILKPGRNDLQSVATFDANRAPIGLETLNRFISGLDTQLNITGFNGSSPIESLAPSLAGLKLNSTLPALTKPLVKSANLTVLPTTGITDDVANSIVYIANPFSSALTITSISAKASSHGIFLANIDTTLNFPAAGNATTASPNVPLSINLYPPDLFGLLRALVVDSGQNAALLDGLIQLAGYTLTPTTNADSPAAQRRSFIDDDKEEDIMAQKAMGVGVNPGVLDDFFAIEDQEDDDGEYSDGVATPVQGLTYGNLNKRANLYTGFNLGTYVQRAFQGAEADLVITSNAVIGQYGTTLTFSQNKVPLGTDDTLLLLLPPLALPIVQKIVDGSILNIDRVTITEPQPNGFVASLQGALTNAGPFDAVVSFPNGLDIFWEGRLLTSAAFPNITLTGDVGSSINVQLQGSIPDVAYFTTFLKAAITNPSFVWTIRGSGLTVSALGIVVPNITITKNVQLAGLNNLAGNVIINSFDVPSNDPAGGLHLTAISTINNPAQVGVALSTFGVNIFDGPVLIGPTAAGSAFTLNALAVTELPLAGRLIQQTTADGLAALSNIFTRFVHNQNTPITIVGDFAGPPDVIWLNDGIKALSVLVQLPSQDFQVIRLISLNQLALYFTVPTAWSPQTDSSNTTANFFLPFAFPLDITSVAGPFTLNYNNGDMAVLNIPTSPALTQVEARILTLMFSNVPLEVFGGSHALFSQFVADFVREVQVTVRLHGSANTVASTAAGVLTITDVPFDLNTNLLGLQGLNARPANVSNLDVVHGFPTYLLITVTTTLFNPSDTTVGAGDVSFAVLFQNNVIGTALIKNILLAPGENAVPTQINYMPVGAPNVASGQLLLENYVQNVTSDAIVQGNSQTTPIPSLLQGLEQITLATQIPPLEKLLVTQGSLVVPKDIAQTGVAMVSVAIANPFTASINLLRLHADANFQSITIGTIDQDLASTNNIISVPGHTTVVSQSLPINLNIDPKNLLRFILAAAAAYNVNLGPLPPFFQQVLDLPDTRTTVMPYPDSATPPCNSGKAFDTLGAILALLKPLAVSIPIQSTLKLDDYQTNLNFIQQPVPIHSDETALYLVGPAAAPLIQLIVNASVLTVSQANATNLVNSGFAVSLLGSLGVNTPADAYIEFPDGITIFWQNRNIATLSLNPLCAQVPDGIPVLTSAGQLTINDEGAFEDFTYFLLTQPNFQWRLYTPTAVVRTLGIRFSNVILEKTITLDAFNGLPGLVISQFNAPSDQPQRINIEASVPITSSASLGVALDYASFDLFFQGQNMGSITSDLLFLAAKQTTLSNFKGFLRDQSNNPAGLVALGVLFSQFLAGQNTTLTIRGTQVVTRANNNQPVIWLTNAFKRFSDSVILPGHIYQIIYSITLSDLTVTVKNVTDPYSVLTSNNMTVATFSNPFGFHLTPLSVAPLITIEYLGANTGQLNLPTIPVTAGTSTGPTDIEPIQFGFRNQILSAIDQASFQAFFAKLADTPDATFGLKGSTGVVARTNIGNPTITGIPFNVTTSLLGIDSFKRVATLQNVQVNDPTPAYIGINLIVILQNPSNLTLFTDQVSLPAYYPAANNVYIGRATIPSLNLYPGSNQVMTLFELMIPNNSTDVQEVLRLYLEPQDKTTDMLANNIGLQIHGVPNANPPLTPYPPLTDALAGITLDTTLAGIGTRIVLAVRVYIPLNIIAQFLGSLLKLNPSGDVYVYAFLDLVNDLPATIDLKQLSSIISDSTNPNAGEYARFLIDFTSANPLTLPAATTTNQPSRQKTTSPVIPNILLSKGLLQSLPLIGHNVNTANLIRTDLTGPNGTYNIPGLRYSENNIPTTYCLTLSSNQEQCDLPLNALGGLLDLLNLLTGNGLLNALIPLLGGLDPTNPAGVFQGITNLPGIGQAVGGVLCTAGNVIPLFGQAACQTPATNTTTTTNSTKSTAPANPLAVLPLSTPATTTTTPAATTPAAATPVAAAPAAATPQIIPGVI